MAEQTEKKLEFTKAYAPFPDDLPELKGPLEDGTYVRPTSGMTHLYYKFDKEAERWFWTPYADKNLWMPVTNIEVSDGKLKGKKPAHFNIDLIDYLNKKKPVPPASAPTVSLDAILADVKEHGIPARCSQSKHREGTEASKMQAMTGGATAHNIFSVHGENEEKTLTESEVQASQTIVFKSCKNSKYIIDAYHTKMMLDDCENCTFTFNGKNITQVMELYKCRSTKLSINTRIQTIQVDKSSDLEVHVQNLSDYNQLIFAGTTRITITLGGEHKLVTGVEELQQLQPNDPINLDIDQFNCRVVKDKLTVEKIIRLDNGFPTTKREKKIYDEKQEENMKAFIKNAGISITRKNPMVNTRQIGRNDPCSCGSGKKFKKCCIDKEEDE